MRQVAAGLLIAVLGGCGSKTPASELANPPEFNPEDQSTCRVKEGQTRPLVVEWPSADRMELETRAKRGVVVVNYNGCEMRLLPHCTVPGDRQYAFETASPTTDTVTIRNADELWANMPIGAAKLEGKLAVAGELNVNMTLIGRFTTSDPQVRYDGLQGVCEGATHIVAGLTVGAFDFYAGADAQVGGGVHVVGAGAGARSTAGRQSITQAGDPTACKTNPGDTQPPHNCSALLRVEVVPTQRSSF
jgi:hypothetical protein